MRVLIVEDEPYMAEAIRGGLRLEAIAADIAGDGYTALELLSFNAYDIAVLDRDIPGPTGDEIANRIVASGSGMPILMLTAAAPWCDLPGAQPRRPPARFRSDRGHRDGVLAGIRSAGRVASRRPHARPTDAHHGRHTHGSDRIALPPDRVGRTPGRVPRARRQLRRD